MEFLGIPVQNNPAQKENTTQIIIDFLEYHLGITITKYDISISHRQPNNEDKKRYGSKYIPPIYCRFVNRSLVYEILSKKRLLQHARNSRGEKFYIRENLTLQRRLLWNRVDTELTSFQFKWVRNGTIFARKNRRSRAIKIMCDEDLDQMLPSKGSACPKDKQVRPSLPTAASEKDTLPEKSRVKKTVRSPIQRVPSYLCNNQSDTVSANSDLVISAGHLRPSLPMSDLGHTKKKLELG